jgi:hypothetical protein
MASDRDQERETNPNKGLIHDKELIRNKDGEILLAIGQGWPKLHFYNQIGYLRPPSPEITLWLLSAASSGVIGNAAYDLLKRLLTRAGRLHGRFKKTVKPDSPASPARNLWLNVGVDSGKDLVYPPPELRDLLVDIGQQAVDAYNNLTRHKVVVRWDQVQIYLLEDFVWAIDPVDTQSGGLKRIEIDLELDSNGGFPVIIYPAFSSAGGGAL